MMPAPGHFLVETKDEDDGRLMLVCIGDGIYSIRNRTSNTEIGRAKINKHS